MRGFAAACWAAILLLGSARAAEPEATTTTTAPPALAPPPQETVVLGTPPDDLVGRWLAVSWIEAPDKGRFVTAVSPWEIARRDGKLDLTVRFVNLPPGAKEAFDKANGERNAWKPSAADLERVRASWDELPAFGPHLARVRHEISAPDGYPDEIKTEPRTRDAIWVVRERQDADPSAAPLIRQAMVYAALAASDGGYTGNFDGVSLAAVPFPVPLKFQGSFRLYPLGRAEKPRGFLAHVLELFEGCGR